MSKWNLNVEMKFKFFNEIWMFQLNLNVSIKFQEMEKYFTPWQLRGKVETGETAAENRNWNCRSLKRGRSPWCWRRSSTRRREAPLPGLRVRIATPWHPKFKWNAPLSFNLTHLSKISPDGSREVVVDQEYGPEHSSDAEVNFLPFYDDKGFH